MGRYARKSTEIFNEIGLYGTAREAAPRPPKPQGAGSIPVPPAREPLNSWGLRGYSLSTIGVHCSLFDAKFLPLGATPQVSVYGPPVADSPSIATLQPLSLSVDQTKGAGLGEGQEGQASQRGGEPFVVARQAAEPSGPSEATFNDPPFGQEHEAHGTVLEQGRVETGAGCGEERHRGSGTACFALVGVTRP